MQTVESEDAAARAALAEQVDCFTEEQVQKLARITPSTLESWRKRGKSPAYVVLGNQFLYPRGPFREFLHARVREPAIVEAKGQL